MENSDEEGFSEEIIKIGSRRNYLIPALWLVSLLLIGIVGYAVGGAKESPKLLATINEAWSNIFASDQNDFVEIVDTRQPGPLGSFPGEPDRIIVGDEVVGPLPKAAGLNKNSESTRKTSPADLTGLKIKEIVFDVEGADDGSERVRISNGGSVGVPMEDFSLQYLRVGGEFTAIKKKNFASGNTVPAGGVFVVGMSCSTAVPCAGVDMSWSQALANDGGTVYLVSDQENLTSNDDSDIITNTTYGTALSL